MMRIILPLIAALLLLDVCLISSSALATDIITVNAKKSDNDTRFEYPMKLLRLALERTKKQYGDYKIRRAATGMTRDRALRELATGNLTLFAGATRREWEEAAIPIRIPLRKGILGYRLFLIRSDSQSQFSKITNIDQLKKLHLGAGSQWSISLALKRLGYVVYGGTKYEPLFQMLSEKRFDYFPRGINEIFVEFETRKNTFSNLKIEETIALYLPLPTYFFITPTRPDLASRIKQGLFSILEDGTMDRIFFEYHSDDIKKARLKDRTIFKLPNLNLSDETPFHRTDFWYHPE
mgnify:CR=1 FL=1